MALADHDDAPPLAIRRHTDRCFHAVEEVVPGGYIVDGVLIPDDDVADVRAIPDCVCETPTPPRPDAPGVRGSDADVTS